MQNRTDDGDHCITQYQHNQLIDVTDAARREGFFVRVALTRKLYDDYVRTPEALLRDEQQAECKRISRLLRMLKAALATRWNGWMLAFTWVARTHADAWRTVPTIALCTQDGSGRVCLILGCTEETRGA